MKLRSVIIDDEQTGIDTLKLLVEKHIADIKVVGQALRGPEGIELIENFKPEVVFLDISMPEMNGFELLEKLNWKGFHLVFTTAYQEYGLRALKKEAIDYLLKPIDYRDLRSAIDRIKQRIGQQQDATRFEYAYLNSVAQYYTNRLAVSSKHGVEYIDPVDIMYFESKSNYTLVYLNGQEAILTPKTLKEFEAQLGNNLNFMRVHNSYVINLHKVLRYLKESDTIVMIDHQKIPLSKSRRTAFFRWLVP